MFNNHKNLIIAMLGLLIVVALFTFIVLGYINAWAWVGMVEYEYNRLGIPTAVQNKKTLWDWLELLIVPAFIAFGILWLNMSRMSTERRIADENRRLEFLERYFSRMEELLFRENLRQSAYGDEVRVVARSRTLDVLRRLNFEQKGQVMRFLYDACLIRRPISLRDTSEPIVFLEEADLTEIDLSWSYMIQVSLYRTSLPGADLQHARFDGAYLFGVDLRGANLSYASFDISARKHHDRDVIINSDFTGADLRGAELAFCNLSGVEMSGANLEDANTREAILDGIRLSKETKISIEQLAAARSYDYAFSWNSNVANDVLSKMYSGELDLNQFPQPFDGGNWSVSYSIFGRYSDV